MIDFLAVTILCTGVAPTYPKTNVEIEIKPATVKYSTIRYEYAEGSMKGTAYIQSIGRMTGWQRSGTVRFISDTAPEPARLDLRVNGDKIERARFHHYSSGIDDAVDCTVQVDEINP